ncbi:MAG: RagB/SusD family nutrient uptake outer membrane protein [Bacteroidales bacterium]|nr:RagB/SusD family nutrient uptake outer membrane protein [Bacteroidales bacterium]
MKRIFVKLLVLSLAVALGSSCIKETFPMSDTATKEQLASSSSALNAMVGAIPAQMATGYLVYGRQEYETDMAWPGIMIALDSVTGIIVDTGDSGYDWYQCYSNPTYGLGPTSYEAYIPWRTMYMFIKSANDVISAVDEENADKDQLNSLAQALAYRALFYYTLANMYEYKAPTDPAVAASYKPENNVTGLTVPLVTEKTTQEEAKSNPRVPVAEMYKFIMDDLDKAEEYINDTKGGTLLPNLGVVYGLKARAYLKMGADGVSGAYAKAVEYADKAIAQQAGSPLTQAQWENPKTGFNNFAANNNSWMWYIQYSAETIGNLNTFVAHMSSEETWTGYGCAVGRGISKELYESIPDTDFRKHSWIDPGKYAYYDYPRNRDFFTHKSSNRILHPYAGIKFRPAQGDYATYKVGGASEVPIMRLEEMYFIKAEATALNGNVGEAKKILNSIVQTRDASYDCSNIADNFFQSEIYRQKVIEFWGEGIVFHDAKRIGAGMHNGYPGTNVPGDFRLNCTGVCPAWNFVIPKTEINGNPALDGNNNPDPTEALEPWEE